MSDFTLFVCTFNSERTLDRCLFSLRRSSPDSKLVVVDHSSSDATGAICERYGAEVHVENVGLGRARQICFELCTSKYLVFIDSDVEIVEYRFFERAAHVLDSPEMGAVVGMAVGHRLAYGLPASLLVLRNSDFKGIRIPDYIDARETYFIQGRLDERHLKTAYLADAMVHRSQYRGMKPEWEGANTRLASGVHIRQLAFALKVIILMSLNSRSARNVAYVPLFYLKFLRGFVNPMTFHRLERGSEGED